MSMLRVRAKTVQEARMDAIALDDSWSVPIGTPVFDRQGRRVGTVGGANNDALLIERGLILRQAWWVRLADVDRVEDGRVILAVTKDQVIRG